MFQPYCRAEASQGVIIKPDQTQEERQCESLLLGKHWKLMQAGTGKKKVKSDLQLYILKETNMSK